MDSVCASFPVCWNVNAASDDAMRSIFPEKRRDMSESTEYSANLMLDEPPFIASTHGVCVLKIGFASPAPAIVIHQPYNTGRRDQGYDPLNSSLQKPGRCNSDLSSMARSEERRVGKECRS